jgi:hypothetical protein
VPTEAEIRSAQGRLESLLERHGLLLCHDSKYPSATACIAGEPVSGSWWGHRTGKLIYETLSRVSESVAWPKLVLGKETLVHRRLWPALVAVAESGQDWQLRGLEADAQLLLKRLRGGVQIRTDEAPRPAGGRKLGTVATELERRLLARSHSEHTAGGHHARILETWGSWAERVGIAKGELPGTEEALLALSSPVSAWIGGGKPSGLLPWLPRR